MGEMNVTKPVLCPYCYTEHPGICKATVATLGAKSQEVVQNLLRTCDGCAENTVAVPCGRCQAVFDAVDWIERLEGGFNAAMQSKSEAMQALLKQGGEIAHLKDHMEGIKLASERLRADAKALLEYASPVDCEGLVKVTYSLLESIANV